MEAHPVFHLGMDIINVLIRHLLMFMLHRYGLTHLQGGLHLIQKDDIGVKCLLFIQLFNFCVYLFGI
ncbi:hypothetical protein D3C74_474120 [compost metagenome]